MTPDGLILTSLMKTFANVFNGGVGNITGDAKWLLGTLIVLDLVLAILMNLDDGDHLKTLFQKILKYGFFIWLVVDYSQLANVVLQSFTMIGLKAGGGGLSAAMFSDPSMIADRGVFVASPILDYLGNLSTLGAVLNMPKMIIMGLAAIAIILCFFIIGIQIFLTYLEFYIVATLALILIPFGTFKHTAFLGEKAIGAVISFGIKLMFLGFIASAAIPVVNSWVLPTAPSYDQCFYTLLGSLAIAFLAWSVPGMAAGMLSGYPSLTGGGVAGFALAGAAGTGLAIDYGKSSGAQLADHASRSTAVQAVRSSVTRGMSAVRNAVAPAAGPDAASAPASAMNAAAAASRLAPTNNSIQPK